MEQLYFDPRSPGSEKTLLEHGRIFHDTDRNALWFNWTGSGFDVRFSGSKLEAEILSCPQLMTAPFEHEDIYLDPVIGIIKEGELLQRIKPEEGTSSVSLFHGENGEHTLSIRKLSENVMGKCALLSLKTDGCFLAPPEQKKLRIEFVGDSITCGYGIESDQPGLRTEEENALLTYAYKTCEALQADYSAVCVTGCGITDPVNAPDLENRGMDSMYAYTDAPLERFFEKVPEQKWDFAGCPADIVVVDLGTNDMIDLSWQNYDSQADLRFRKNYRSLIEQIRDLNGTKTAIVCTLGPMSYYLWDEILDVLKEYKRFRNDKNLFWFKFGEMNPLAEGIGSDGHPSAKTHARMAEELTRFLKSNLL